MQTKHAMTSKTLDKFLTGLIGFGGVMLMLVGVGIGIGAVVASHDHVTDAWNLYTLAFGEGMSITLVAIGAGMVNSVWDE